MRLLAVSLFVVISVAACLGGSSDHGTAGSSDASAITPPVSPVPTGGISRVPTPTPVPSLAVSARAEDTQGSFHLVFELPKATWSAGETITGLATLSVVGAKGVDLGGSGVGLIGFAFADVAGTHDVQPMWTADCRPYRLDPGSPITSPIMKSGGYAADQPDASFDRAFLTDPVISLPAGDWKITAVADFIEKKDCSGQSHIMPATVVVHVTP